ncbi:ExbD/TolR family protein [Marinobacter nauticus]|jgi:biopolymer transport protein ExbD|uniref:ExbD/TolR family protein n=1 Tax=Marinobacter nauticus TaxID=2743 RepID=UPI001C99F728|nr:biopolymer transporter ExbD [Marinobacter nauticus]MBY5960542.1 biopolymer transporter ExbD [Marinobacter nauticus]
MRRFAWNENETADESTIDVTPMLDVVFILLIFFLVTASFVREAGIEVERPQATTAESQDKAAILIAIDSSDGIWIDRRKVAADSVTGMVARLHSENPRGSVVIQADADASTRALVAVMDATRRAGVSDIALATEQ